MVIAIRGISDSYGSPAYVPGQRQIQFATSHHVSGVCPPIYELVEHHLLHRGLGLRVCLAKLSIGSATIAGDVPPDQ